MIKISNQHQFIIILIKIHALIYLFFFDFERKMLGMKNSRRKVPSTNTVTVNNDILENNILPRLPVKSLFRFRCVCKRWDSLLTADSIFSLQKPLSLKPPSGLVYWNEKQLAFLSTDGRPMNVPDPKLSFLGEFVSVTNSCNGLICGFYVREGLWPEIYVCNPVTKQVRSTRMPKRGLIVGLAFDPSSPNPHYKLMCPFLVYRNASHNEYGFNLFVSSTGMWRESKERIRISPKSLVTGRSFFVDGVLYFKATNDVIWFQIDDDLAGVVPLPLSDKMITATLGEYKSKLSYIQITLSDIEIWTLKNFHWKKKRCVGLDLLDVYCRPKLHIIDHLKKILKTLEANYRTRQSFRPLPLALDDYFLFQVGAKAYFYNMRTSEVSMICQSDRMMGNFFTCIPYTNSFVPIPE